MPTGSQIQVVYALDGEVATGTTLMPLDDTIPQITEGTEFLSASITPTSTTNKLKIEVQGYLGASTSTESIQHALFQDSTANAIAAMVMGKAGSAGEVSCATLVWWMDAGTTSSTTFSWRAGTDSAATTSFNGTSGGSRRLGGVSASSITITEVQV